MEFDEIVKFVKGMKSGDHVILITSELDDRRKILFTYLNSGIDRGEACAYVVSRGTPEQVKKEMEGFGIDAGRNEREKALRVIDYRNWYIIDGKFDYNRTMGLWKQLARESEAMGFKGLRVAGEMDCFIEHDLIDGLLEYEYALHRVLELPIAAICSYDVGQLLSEEKSFEVLMNLLNAHSTVIMVGANKLGATNPNEILLKIKL